MSEAFADDAAFRDAIRQLLSTSTSPERRSALEESFLAAGEDAVPHLRLMVENARSRPAEVHLAILTLINRFSERSIDLAPLARPLAGFLNTMDEVMRQIVTQILIRMGKKAKPAEDHALGCVRNSNRQVVLCGLNILRSIGTECSKSIGPRLQVVLKSFPDDLEIATLARAVLQTLSNSSTSGRYSIAPVLQGGLPPFPRDCLAGRSCLIVEDLKAARTVLSRLVGLFGMTAQEAADGDSAVTFLRACAATGSWPDVLLLDMRLPRQNGIQVLQCLRRELASELPVIALSGINAREIILAAREYGVKEYLTKPVGAERAIKAILNVLSISANAPA